MNDAGLIRQPNRWAPSQRPYALNPDTVRTVHDEVIVDAVWVSYHRAPYSVVTGTITLGPAGCVPDDLEAAAAAISARKGVVRWRARWDGDALSVHRAWPLGADSRAATIERLDAIRDWLPSAPYGHVGWFYWQGGDAR